jgi:hypothetical protein
MNENDSIDSLLDDALKGDIDSAVGTDAPPAPRYRSSNTGRRLRLVGLTTIPLALSFRLVTALAAAGVAAAGGTAVLVSSHGHGTPGGTQSSVVTVSSAPPSAKATNHGSVVKSAVASCKAARASPHASPKPSPGSRGIGACVSAVASAGHAGSDGAGDGAGDTGGKPSHPTPKPHPSPGK